MKFSFEISNLALIDLDEIWEFTAEQWSKAQANKYYKEIFQTINEICLKPEIGKSLEDVKIGHRGIMVKSHMIVYKIVKHKIFIDRILQQKMDIDNYLNEL